MIAPLVVREHPLKKADYLIVEDKLAGALTIVFVYFQLLGKAARAASYSGQATQLN